MRQITFSAFFHLLAHQIFLRERNFSFEFSSPEA
ncbi:hypothetical protein NC652_016100 [Populus alba x Populus x berolinensis]|uniref:Uncharacterized protein n=1 Tax=Populus alba x Populus x berolinensis TaxID=444605 RepID=A0AAD6VYZ6_9ROSI|nr:hypothetical protein NC652_016100 [Populus alba x Populus x berolinensis]KAJ6992852.1 hypothetical protein NC653_016071 [Populus alba x Populus x berolinensis]